MKRRFAALLVVGVMLVLGCQREDSAPIPSPPGGVGGGSPIGASSQEEEALKGILQKDPNNLNTLIRLGNLYMDSQRFNEAIENYSKALEIDPKNNNVRVDMGVCYRRLGRPDMAEKYFREALEIDPNHGFANMNLAVVLAYDFGKYDEAITYFENYLKVDPASPNAPQVREQIEKLRQMAAKEGSK